MKKILTLSLLFAFTIGFSEAQAQDITKFIKKRKNKAEDTAVERTGKEADKAVTKEVNKALDKIFGKEKKTETPEQTADSTQTSTTNTETISQDESKEESSNSSSRQSSGSTMGMKAMMGAMGISSGTADVKPIYEYEGYIEMTITKFDKGEEEESTVYKTYMNSDTPDYGVVINEDENEDLVFIVYDTENSLMLTLSDSDGEKTGFAVNFTPEQTEAIAEDMEEEVESTDPYEAYKTGKTKQILGYKCDEYIIEDDYSITTMWITEELDKKMKKSYNSNSSFTGVFTHGKNARGVTMENITEDKSDHDKTIMIVTDLDLNKKHSISTAGYNIMNMGAVMEEDE